MDRSEFLYDIMLNAGIGYWADARFNTDTDNLDFEIWITERDSGEDFIVRPADIERGIKLITLGETNLVDEMVSDIALDSIHDEMTNMDSLDCDAIVQAAVFGKVIYG